MLAPLKMYMLLMEGKNHDPYQSAASATQRRGSPALFLLVNLKCDGADNITLFCSLAKDREASSSFYRAKIRLILNVARRAV